MSFHPAGTEQWHDLHRCALKVHHIPLTLYRRYEAQGDDGVTSSNPSRTGYVVMLRGFGRRTLILLVDADSVQVLDKEFFDAARDSFELTN